MGILVVTPLPLEFDALVEGCAALGCGVERGLLGRLPIASLPELGMSVARGGVGKAQFAVHTQHLLDTAPWDLMICAGTAGALSPEVAVGDVIVSTVTIEHDYNNRMFQRPKPRFEADAATLAALRHLHLAPNSFRVHFGPVASGDEDVVDATRRDLLREVTGALCVAWEGAGGARACAFSQTPFIELRGLTDQANHLAVTDFQANLRLAMTHIASLLTTWRRTDL
ncbi:MAG: 5'-methylthioadenosine/S-adenosylhomocysteine nucleosidase [Anaerolineae bacterium]|nr:5'-methylthioadenosine/S-adenosylhomocysteine nucleosidase [Anaerolineae bacterium]